MITEGHLNRRYQGRSGGRSPSLIDIAQDHALRILANGGVFELGVTFKGGTALRKFRAGNAGRFSTDLDFAVRASALGVQSSPSMPNRPGRMPSPPIEGIRWHETGVRQSTRACSMTWTRISWPAAGS